MSWTCLGRLFTMCDKALRYTDLLSERHRDTKSILMKAARTFVEDHGLEIFRLGVPCSAELKPCTSLAEFSAKKRWRYIMRTSAWQLRCSTSEESLIRMEKLSAAWEPSSGSLNNEKIWRRDGAGEALTSSRDKIIHYITIFKPTMS